MWWIFFALVSASWVVPMLGARQAALPWWFFAALALLWSALFVAVPFLYDLGTRVRRKPGLNRLADWSERERDRLLPPLRAALAAMALITLAAWLF
jgi:hypothetical protein